MNSNQEMPKLILATQGALMIGIACAPLLTGYRFLFPHNLLDWIGTLCSIVGTLLVVMSVRTLRKTFTVQAGVRPGTELARTFPFNFSRNPMYLGGILMCISWSLLQRSHVAALLTAALVAILHLKIKIEERNLGRYFGEDYRLYRESVRRYF